MAKFLRLFAIIFLSFIALGAGLYFTFLMITRNAVLDESKLISVDKQIVLYDDSGKEIQTVSSSKQKSVQIENLQPHTINAFIASEDRKFYSHNGLNYKRMIKAAYVNLVSRSFKQGASTISQQLIKNTHLSGDKTIARKLNEIRLTRKLEKKYSKNSILEMYLNTIYFGHNCYGLQSAANFYFDKKAEDLDLQESAVLVGLLTSPNNYSPFKNPERCLSRRNAVLKAMLDCKYISKETYETTIKQPINAVYGGKSGKYADYFEAVFDEMDKAIDFYGDMQRLEIHTFLNETAQKILDETQFPDSVDHSAIITDKKGEVIAFDSTVGGILRQPGSTIKPIGVYAPAIEENMLYPFTRIVDEEINFNGYSPKNSDDKYHGAVTVAESLKMSYNVPAVKTLNGLTVEKAEKYLNKMNIQLEEGDKNLALALGGMSNGVSLKQLADAYMQFSSGVYIPSRFIDKIYDENGNLIYKSIPQKSKIFSDGTSSLMNEMLIEVSKSGTAKKLKNLNFDVASKTGTCGDEKGNTDAYSICYTSENCLGVWLGNSDNTKNNLTGGRDCCNAAKSILEKLYSQKTPKNLEVNLDTESIEIDAEKYYNENKIDLCDPLSPKLNKLKVKTKKSNIPSLTSSRFSSPVISQPKISVENNRVKIELCQTKYYSYLINRAKNGKNSVIYDGKWQQFIFDEPSEGTYVYTITPYYFDGDKKYSGKSITLPSVKIGENLSPQVKIPSIADEDWFLR